MASYIAKLSKICLPLPFSLPPHAALPPASPLHSSSPQPSLLTQSLSGAGITTEPTALSLLHTTPPLHVEPIPVLCSSPSRLHLAPLLAPSSILEPNTASLSVLSCAYTAPLERP
ncbi:hypothetical protein M0R45_009319 [Rubus argutus]|uniref:Uncharacterized protein n=1 Tax=Rubus argutus TaxID=59490 RepID=A0AAW1Y3P3_RUBAR